MFEGVHFPLLSRLSVIIVICGLSIYILAPGIYKPPCNVEKYPFDLKYDCFKYTLELSSPRFENLRCNDLETIWQSFNDGHNV